MKEPGGIAIRFLTQAPSLKSRLVFWTLFLICIWLGSEFGPKSAYACAAFYATDGDAVLVGKNMDAVNPHTKIGFVAAEEGKYGWMYHASGDGFPQGGLNEHGVFWEGAATPYLEMPESMANKTEYPGWHIMEKVMEECTTLEAALAIFETYYYVDLLNAHYLVGDRFGHSAIVGGDHVIVGEKRYQIVTNFNVERMIRAAEIDTLECARYRMIYDRLQAGDVSVNAFRGILSAVRQESYEINTLYSCVFDLKNLRINVYHFHNYEDVAVFDLLEALEKGTRELALPALFPESFMAGEYMAAYDQEGGRAFQGPGEGD